MPRCAPEPLELAADLDRLGVEVLFDDRQASPGVKFKDAELLGVPWIVVVGPGLGKRRGRAARPVQRPSPRTAHR